jgi:hypothetical protein
VITIEDGCGDLLDCWTEHLCSQFIDAGGTIEVSYDDHPLSHTIFPSKAAWRLCYFGRWCVYRARPSKLAELLRELLLKTIQASSTDTAPQSQPNLKAIITYNYDDLLEEELKRRGDDLRFRSIYEPACIHRQINYRIDLLRCSPFPFD